MDFESESLTSDDESFQPTPSNVHIKFKKATRKIRSSSDFMPPEDYVLSDEDNSSLNIKVRKQKERVSFLPKIDDLDTNFKTTTSTRSRVQNGSFSKNVAILKINKLKMERKIMSSAQKYKQKLKSKATAGIVEHNYPTEKRMSLKLKKDEGVWRSVSNLKAEEIKPIFRELYVKLVPLENTNLLSEEQLREFKSKIAKNYENKNKLSLTSNVQSFDFKLKFPEFCRPCKVHIQRIPLDNLILDNKTVNNQSPKPECSLRSFMKLSENLNKSHLEFNSFNPENSSSPLAIALPDSQVLDDPFTRKSSKFCTLEVVNSTPIEEDDELNRTYEINGTDNISGIQNLTFNIESPDSNDNIVKDISSSINDRSSWSEKEFKMSKQKIENDSVWVISSLESTADVASIEIIDESSNGIGVKDLKKPSNTFTPKSALKTTKSDGSVDSVKSKRRVTFSDINIVIVDNISYNSPLSSAEDDAECTERSSFSCRKLNKTDYVTKRKKQDKVMEKNKSISPNVPRAIKMPDFTRIHQKMFDKMLNIQEYSQQKSERAQMLLSNQKLTRNIEHVENMTQSLKKAKSVKKQLEYNAQQSSSRGPLKKQNFHFTALSNKPNQNKNLKVTRSKLIKLQEISSVANKTKPRTLKINEMRTEIKGVRTNRRFELLMKMRNKN